MALATIECGVIFQRHTPSPPLRGLVEYYWYHEGLVSAHSMERLLPDGAIELIIDLTEVPKAWVRNHEPARVRTVRRIWISGQHSGPILIEAANHSCMIGARFSPGGARAVISGPISDLNESVVEMDAIWGRAAHALRDRLFVARSIESRFQILDQALMSHRTGWRDVGAVVQHALNRISHAPTVPSMRNLAKELGVSQTTLTRLFHEHVGLGPKRLARIFRFQTLLRRLAAGSRPQLAAVAAAHGYFDQSHFIRDFNSLSGMHPTEYLDTSCEYFNYVPVDERKEC